MVNIEEICIVVHTKTNYVVHSTYPEERFQVVLKGHLIATLETSHCSLQLTTTDNKQTSEQK